DAAATTPPSCSGRAIPWRKSGVWPNDFGPRTRQHRVEIALAQLAEAMTACGASWPSAVVLLNGRFLQRYRPSVSSRRLPRHGPSDPRAPDKVITTHPEAPPRRAARSFGVP